MTTLQLQALKKQTEVELIVASTMEQLGASDVTLTYSQASRKYGSWFKERVEKGKILPCRIGSGDAPTRWFSVKTILAMKAVEVDEMINVMAR